MEGCFERLDLEYVTGETVMKASSDIGNADYWCQVVHPVMGIGKPYECHTLEFAGEMTKENIHEAIENAAAYMLTMIESLYTGSQLLEQIKTEHQL